MDIEQTWRRAHRAIREVRCHFEKAHRDYIESWPHDRSLMEEANRTYQALNWKLLPLSFHFEMLLGLVEMKDENISILHCKPAASEWTLLEHDIGLLTLESILFQYRAFLDLHMHYGLLLLGAKTAGKMNRTKFRKTLERLDRTRHADALATYYRDRVWAKGCWGELLVSLRDKIAHHDRLYPNYSSDDIELQIPVPDMEITGRTLERLAADLLNGIISLLQETMPILTSRAWPTNE